jgi:4-aminobutyrate aminotransferase-like enzyme/Ser/Thr protein kinase RdoA (MazF antagonist)
MNYEDLQITIEKVTDYVKQFYGIDVKAFLLGGYEDFNFKLETEMGEFYTLKISRSDLDEKWLDFQTNIFIHLTEYNLPIQLPKPVKNLNGKYCFSFKDDKNAIRWIRMNTWVDGDMIFDYKYHATELLIEWGKTCGLLNQALMNFDHSAAHIQHEWDLSLALNNRKFRTYIQGELELSIADYFWNLYEIEVLPLHSKLSKSIIHSDVNDYNLLVNSNLGVTKITGVIDFGDALYTHRINELAIACAYAAMFKSNPLEAVTNLVKGYHQMIPLIDIEIQILYILIANRLLTTVGNAAKNRVFEPENEYLFVSEKPAWDVLKLWYEIPQNLAYYAFRNACNLEPCPQNILFNKIANKTPKFFADVVDFSNKKVTSLDLSIGSLDLGNNNNFENPRKLQKRIDDILWEAEAEIGVGGYDEIRPFYNTNAYILESNNGREWRTVHLGWDVWIKVETPIFSALDGIVFSIKDNKGDDNYGPTIILKHEVFDGNDNLIFYTLYGHLSPISRDLKIGDLIKKGEQIATVGTFPQNGNWAEHLHFQVILDLLEQDGDFYGVCTPNDKAIWLSICPNPDLNKIEKSEIGKTQGKTTEILKKRFEYLGKNLSLSYEKPLHIVRAYRQYLYDTNGRRYLDTVNNVAHIGHQHPKVVKAAQRQIEVLNTNTRYLHKNIVNYAEALLKTLPSELSVCYFVNSGSEANELALRMAKTVSKQSNMIALEVGYHGNTNETIAVSSYKFDSKGGNGKPAKTHIVPIPDVYRGIYRNIETAGTLYANHIQETIEEIQKSGENIAGFICESILSCGGQIVLPPNYLKNAYSFIRNAGGLCIADEVQVGFGRVGAHFWGFELQAVVPDIVTMGKPIGNGHPLAAVVTTKKIAEAFDNGMEYFNTFGGNPVSCAIGNTVLKIIQIEKLQENALEVGQYIKVKLELLKSKFSIIGDVRGHGLFLGIELIRDQKTLEPAKAEADYIVNRMKANGILMSIDGPFYNVLKIKPPMCFSRNDADILLEIFEKILITGKL